MTRPAAASAEPTFWSDFLELTRRLGLAGSTGSDPRERELVLAALDESRREVGARGATLALETDEGGCEDLTSGTIGGGEGEPPALSLPGGEVRYWGAETGRSPSPQSLAALSIAAHAYRLGLRVKRHRFEVNYRGVELEALYDVGLAIASTLNLDELAEAILLRAVSLIDARTGALYLSDAELAVEGGTGGDGLFLSGSIGGDAKPRLEEGSPELEALLGPAAGGCPGVLPGCEHLLAVRIESEGRRGGLLVVGDKESRRGVGPFAAADRRTLSLFANQAAIALENARLHRQALEKERLQREAELAADIQRQLLPQGQPELEGYEIFGWNRSARLVGGDYYHFLPLPDGRLAPVVADVTGKGMPAALLVSTLHSALQLLLEHERVGPELVSRLNRHIVESSTPNRFITLFIADIGGEDGHVRFVNAGHNPPILVRRSGETQQLASAGFPVGLFSDAVYQTGSLDMEPGDLLCCYSDGITECESPGEEEFGEDRLVGLLTERRGRPLAEILETVDSAVREFAAGAPQGDDQTVVLLRRR